MARDSLRDFRHTAIDVIVVLVGVTLLLTIGYFPSPVAQAQLAAVATGLIAAGLVTYLTRRFHAEPQPNLIEMVSPTRVALNRTYRQRKYEATETEIVSIALSNVLKEIASDDEHRLLNRVVYEGAKVRLALLSPAAAYVRQRAAEDGVPPEELRNALKASVRLCETIHASLEKVCEDAEHNQVLENHGAGLFVVRVLDLCPHFTLHRTDDEILWGLYTSAHRGLYSPVFRVKRDCAPLFDHLSAHFERLWSLSDGHDLIRYYGPQRPTLNRALMTELLGPGWERSAAKPAR